MNTVMAALRSYRAHSHREIPVPLPRLALCLLLTTFTLTGTITAQPGTPDAHIALPSSPDQWLNFPPLSLDQLEGKGVVLYFFEEGCPSCAKKWPDLLELSSKYELEPVVFIAVNSGNSPAKVASYVREHGITWPVIVDTDRMLEQTVLAKTISLENIHQTRVRKADGSWEDRLRSQLPDAVRAAAEGAKWRVEPAGVPLELRPAWGMIELGNFAAAEPLIAKATRRGDEQMASAAETLKAAVQTELEEQATAIRESLKAGDDWAAYQALGTFLKVFDRYEVPEDFDSKFRELRKSDKVRAEQSAAKKLDRAIRTGSSGSPSAVKRAVTLLEKLIADSPETEAAQKAQELLDQVAAESSVSEPGAAEPNQ